MRYYLKPGGMCPWLWFALVTAALLGASACKDHAPTADLLAQGTASATSLRTYYAALEQTVLDSWEFEAAFSKLTGVSFGRSQESAYQVRLAALHNRAEMARELGQLYSVAAQLRAGSDEQARRAAEQLGQTLKAVPKLPTAGVDPAEPLGKAAETLLGFVRTRNLKAANRSFAAALDDMTALYDKEVPVYNTLSVEREQSGLHLLETLTGLKMVSVAPLLRDLASRLGAPWNETGGLPPQAVETGLGIARIRARRAELLAACATDGTGTMLRELAAQHRDFASGRSVSLKALREATDRATICLQQRAQLFAAGKP